MPAPLERVCSACATVDELKAAIAAPASSQLGIVLPDHSCTIAEYLQAELLNRP